MEEKFFHFQAHLWIQTMQELRQGVKLKKTDYTKTPFEYELTPYEMLMDDIRSRRYVQFSFEITHMYHQLSKDGCSFFCCFWH